jgi:hypothetical protein
MNKKHPQIHILSHTQKHTDTLRHCSCDSWQVPTLLSSIWCNAVRSLCAAVHAAVSTSTRSACGANTVLTAQKLMQCGAHSLCGSACCRQYLHKIRLRVQTLKCQCLTVQNLMQCGAHSLCGSACCSQYLHTICLTGCTTRSIRVCWLEQQSLHARRKCKREGHTQTKGTYASSMQGTRQSQLSLV